MNINLRKRVIYPSFFTIVFLLSSGFANADVGPARGYMWEGWGSGHMTFGIVPMALFWLGLIVFLGLLIRWISRDSLTNRPAMGKTALDILQERFARGEIDKQEFEESKRLISDSMGL